MRDNSEVPIIIVKGTDFYLPVVYVTEIDGAYFPINITGYSAQMQVRPTVPSEGTPLVDISTAQGTIVVDGPSGKFELIIPKSVTETLPVGKACYDLMVTHVSGWTEQLIFGKVEIRERTTK